MEFRPKILIIDNHLQRLSLLGEVLKQMGTEPHCVPSSLQAAELINNEKFDGIFLHWKIAGMSGLRLVKRIRQSETNQRCIIFMLNRNSSRAAAKQCFRQGVNFFLQKPINIGRIFCLLSSSRYQMLEERRRCQRVPVEISVLCQWNQRKVKGQSLNLSAEGMLVVVEETPPRKGRVRLQFSLPGDSQPFDLCAQVAHLTPNRRVGFQFIDLNKELEQRLVEFTTRAGAAQVN